MSDEIWKPVTIAGFEADYEASSEGRIRRATATHRYEANYILTPSPNEDGYLRVTCTAANSRQARPFVHSMVAGAFHGSRPTGHQIDHINGNPADNRAINLEYVTAEENIRRMHLRRRGLPKRRTFLDDAMLNQILELRRAGHPPPVIAAELSIRRATVARFLAGRTHKEFSRAG